MLYHAHISSLNMCVKTFCNMQACRSQSQLTAAHQQRQPQGTRVSHISPRGLRSRQATAPSRRRQRMPQPSRDWCARFTFFWVL